MGNHEGVRGTVPDSTKGRRQNAHYQNHKNNLVKTQAKIEVIDKTLCEGWLYHDLTDQQFCAGREEGRVDACQVRESRNL